VKSRVVAFTHDRLEQRIVMRVRRGKIVVAQDLRRDRKGRVRDYAKSGRPVVQETPR